MKLNVFSQCNAGSRMIPRVRSTNRLQATGLAFLGMALAMSCGLTSAQAQNTRYAIQDLGVVGSNFNQPGQPFKITNNGSIAAAAGVGQSERGFLRIGTKGIDIGNPGLGGNSFAFGVNDWGVGVGEAESTAPSLSTTEDFCGFQAMGYTSSPTPCVPFLSWQGTMYPLQTLGGTNGVANQINNHAVVAGFAETAIADPGCPAPQIYQFKPVVWSPATIQELPTGNDPDGVASSINDLGQVVGATGTCGTFSPAALNNLGQVVGSSDLAGDQTFHAFLWTSTTKMIDLGTVNDAVDNDYFSDATAINDQGEIVGISASADFSILRGFVRQNGKLVDLNSLVVGTTPLYLLTACSINSKGQIIGIGLDPNTGYTHAYLANPVN